MMMRIETYLFFGKNAAEAMKFYQSLFGGELTITLRGEVDPDAPDYMKPLVINAELAGDGFTFRGADNTDVVSEPQNRMAVTVSGTDLEKMTTIFNGLGVDGVIESPLEKMFWGDTFGTLVDRYGISWQFNIQQPTAS